MKNFKDIILEENRKALSHISSKNTKKFIAEIRKAKRIYIAGVGRSGLVAKAFGQRLMHLGFDVHLADEITAPGITKKDVLITCSGTGSTYLTIYMAKKAFKIGARVLSITANPSSELTKYSDLVIEIPVKLENYKSSKGVKSSQPAHSLFEQAVFIYLDSCILHLMNMLGMKGKDIKIRHANLE